jgi:hypothetical protein
VIRSGERLALKVVACAGSGRQLTARGCWRSGDARWLYRCSRARTRRADWMQAVAGCGKVVLGTSPADLSALSFARSVRIGTFGLGFVLGRVVPAPRRAGCACEPLGSRSWRVRASCRAKEVDPSCRGERSRLSSARNVSRSPTRTLQLTRPSVAALPQDLAAERQSLDRQEARLVMGIGRRR